LIFPTAAYRTSKSVLRGNRKGQPGLWAYGVSGQLLIALLRVSDAGNLDLVRNLLSAHAYRRTQGLSCCGIATVRSSAPDSPSSRAPSAPKRGEMQGREPI
jgi:hypothetical protein